MAETILVPFKWEDPSPQSIIVTGSFDNWQSTGHLTKLPAGNFEGNISMPCGAKIVFKYIVDGVWLVREDEPKEYDESGNLNHFVIVPHAPLAEVAPPKPEEIKAAQAIVPPTQSDEVVALVSEQPIRSTEEIKAKEAALNQEQKSLVPQEEEIKAAQAIVPPTKPDNVVALVSEQPIRSTEEIKAQEVALEKEQKSIMQQKIEKAKAAARLSATSAASATAAAVASASAQISKTVNSDTSKSKSPATTSTTSTHTQPSSSQPTSSPTSHHASASEKLTSAANIVKAAATDVMSKTAEFVSAHSPHKPAPVSKSSNNEIYDTDSQPALPPKPLPMDPVVAPAVTSVIAVNALPSTPVKSSRIPLVPYAASPFTPAPSTNGNSNKENGIASNASVGNSPKTFPVGSPASDNSSVAGQNKRGILSSFSRRSTENRDVSGGEASGPPSSSQNPVLRKRKSSLLAMVKAMWGSPGKGKNAAAGVALVLAVFSFAWVTAKSFFTGRS